jgi:hypothetical protein
MTDFRSLSKGKMFQTDDHDDVILMSSRQSTKGHSHTVALSLQTHNSKSLPMFSLDNK